MKKVLTEKEKLQKQLNAIVEKEEREMIEANYPQFQKLIGKCFKSRNSYGGGQKPWWLYTKITDIKPSDIYKGANDRVLSYFTGYQFQTCIDGSITIQEVRNCVHSLDKQIGEKEFNEAFEKMSLRIKELKSN